MFVARIAALAAAALCAASVADAKTLRWASQGDALTLDPHAQNEGPTTAFNSHVYEALITRDHASKVPGARDVVEGRSRPTPGSSSCARREVPRRHAVHRRRRGVLVSARSRRPRTSSLLSPASRSAKVDDLTVDIITNGPAPSCPTTLTNILHHEQGVGGEAQRHQAAGLQEQGRDLRGAQRQRHRPFMLESREPDVKTVLKRNPNWWGQARSRRHHRDGLHADQAARDAHGRAALGRDRLRARPAAAGHRAAQADAPSSRSRGHRRTASIFLGMDMARDELQYSDVKGKNPFKDMRVRQAHVPGDRHRGDQAQVMRGLSVPAGIDRAAGRPRLHQGARQAPASTTSPRPRSCSPRPATRTASRSRSTARTTATSTTRRSARRSPACWRRSASRSSCRRDAEGAALPEDRRSSTPASTCWAGACRRSIRTTRFKVLLPTHDAAKKAGG